MKTLSKIGCQAKNAAGSFYQTFANISIKYSAPLFCSLYELKIAARYRENNAGGEC